MALVFGAIFGACWLVVFWGTRERENLPAVEKVSLVSWLSIFSNKAYKNFLGIFLSFQIAVDLVLALFKITKTRFDAVLKGIDAFKAGGNIDKLSEQETADLLIAAGMEKNELWGYVK